MNGDHITVLAFDGDEPVESINRDLDSIKEALNTYDKVFLEIGYYGYDDEYTDEPYFMFDSNKHIWNYLPSNLAPVEMFFTGDGGTTDATSIGCYLVCDRAGMFTGRHDYILLRVGNWYYNKGDMAMSEERNTKLLEDVVKNQRKIISQVHGKPAKEVPQLWALYKEVQDYYDDGMRVPDDVIMLLCDDNWGNVRRVPNAKERKHPGGWGLYYHVDYVGAPRNSKVLNCTPIQNMWEQLSLAYENGIDKLWILNVGDLKPMEYPIQLFMDLAWQGTNKYTPSTLVSNHTVPFCASIVGEAEAGEAAAILNRYCKLAGRVTPEMLPDQSSTAVIDHDEELATAVMKLPRKLREVILLHYYQELNVNEIAVALGISHSSVSGRLKRGCEKLKKLLEGREIDE